MRVYVAGPMALGDFADNMRRALFAADRLIEMGYYPFVPHLYWHVNVAYHRPTIDWLTLDREWLEQCHALYRIPGESHGADLEERWATELGMTIWRSLTEVPLRSPWVQDPAFGLDRALNSEDPPPSLRNGNAEG